MTGAGRVIVDACTLENFAVVKRLDLLQSLFGEKAGWTSAVEQEIKRNAEERPYLEPLLGAPWLGDPIDFDDPLVLQRIDRIRRGLGGAAGLPRQHLGEAQALYYVTHVDTATVFATDDGSAYAMALARNRMAIDTPEIARRCYDIGLVGCPKAYRLLTEMVEAGRGIRLPKSHWHVCPS